MEDQQNSQPIITDQMPPTKTPSSKRSHSGLIISLVVVVVLFFGILILVDVVSSNNTKNKSITISKLAPAEVSITSSGFVPQTMTVKVGQPIVWTNNDSSPHQINSDPFPTDNAVPGLNSGSGLSKGQTYRYVFSKAGTYTYHDDLNPYKFKGTVIVQ